MAKWKPVKAPPTPVEECSTCFYYCEHNCCRRYPKALPRKPEYWCGEWKEIK